MFNDNIKVIRDSIHGYIQIPETIVKEIVDSELFQRLRNIEQTNMRALFPAARHDRFIHSLGVYALGYRHSGIFPKMSNEKTNTPMCSEKTTLTKIGGTRIICYSL